MRGGSCTAPPRADARRVHVLRHHLRALRRHERRVFVQEISTSRAARTCRATCTVADDRRTRHPAVVVDATERAHRPRARSAAGGVSCRVCVCIAVEPSPTAFAALERNLSGHASAACERNPASPTWRRRRGAPSRTPARPANLRPGASARRAGVGGSRRGGRRRAGRRRRAAAARRARSRRADRAARRAASTCSRSTSRATSCWCCAASAPTTGRRPQQVAVGATTSTAASTPASRCCDAIASRPRWSRRRRARRPPS